MSRQRVLSSSSSSSAELPNSESLIRSRDQSPAGSPHSDSVAHSPSVLSIQDQDSDNESNVSQIIVDPTQLQSSGSAGAVAGPSQPSVQVNSYFNLCHFLLSCIKKIENVFVNFTNVADSNCM